MKDKCDIVLIDSGLDPHSPLASKKNDQGVFIRYNEDIEDYIVDCNFFDNIGHGTAVHYLLKKRLENVNIFIIKLFDNGIDPNAGCVSFALKYILNNLDCKIVHLSSGITYCEDISALEDMCNKLISRNVIVVAAFDNDGSISYPAAFNNVIGVDWSLECHRVAEFEYVEESPINIRAIGKEQRVYWLNGEFKMVSGSSFAAPHITATVYNLLKAGVSGKKEILDRLRSGAKKVYNRKPYEKQKDLFEIQKAVLFPFNKEMHSFVRFRHLLDFEIARICDLKSLGNVRKSAFEILGIDQQNDELIITNIDKLDWEEHFDTVILGHTREISELYGRDFIAETLEKCKKHNKNIICFDNLNDYSEKFNQLYPNNRRIHWPQIKELNIPKNRFGKLRHFCKPLIAVMGTTPRQGKYTLQLRLREKFINAGYRVGQLGTEPSSLLFGMDVVYPMGYDATVKLAGYQSIQMINHLLGIIEDNTPDIILVGGQSQSLHYSTGNLGFYPLYNHELLLASNPDMILLCVNYYDEFDYIKRTIDFLESYQETKVSSLILFPVMKDLRWSILGNTFSLIEPAKLTQKVELLSRSFHLPVFISENRDHMEALFNHCIDFF